VAVFWIGAAPNAASCCPPTQAVGLTKRFDHENERRTCSWRVQGISVSLLDSGTAGLAYPLGCACYVSGVKTVAPRAY
jgi:hypothetical protein